jgi:iron complex outermembrane recepter protein
MKKIVLLAATFVCFSQVYAENPTIQKKDSLTSIKKTGMKSVLLQDVQVVSTRVGANTPIANQNFVKSQINAVNFGHDMPSLLSLTPSVTFSSDAGNGIGYTDIHVRGTDPTRISVTTNGVPINDAESSKTYWVNIPDIVSSAETIQIQRGVGASTNGSGAFGATINIQTDNIGVKPYAGVDLSAGSYGSHKETFRFGTGLLGGHWGFQGRLSNIGSDGYIDRASTKLNSYFMQGGYFSGNTVVKFITFNGTEKTYHAWDYASKADMETYGRTYNPCGQYNDANGKTVYYKDQTDNYHQQNYQLIWNQVVNSYWSSNVTLHYTNGYGYYEQYKTEQKLAKYTLTDDFSIKSDLIRRKIMANNFYGFVGSLNYDNKKNLTLSLGGGWNKYDGDHYGQVLWVRTFSGSLEPNHEYYRSNGIKYDGNFFGKLNYSLFKGFHTYIDLQYRHVGYTMTGSSQEYDKNNMQKLFNINEKYNFFNPKFGIYYDMNKNNTIYVSYAIAHKEPTRDDFENMMAESEYVTPKSERLNDLELGYKYQSKIFSAGANLYYMNYDNQFVPTGGQDSNGEMVVRNVKDSYRIGLELMAALNPFKGFNWNANATWSKNREKNTNIKTVDNNYVNVGTTHLAFSPDFIFNNIFSYEYKGFKASVMSKYVGEQYMTNSNFRSYIDEDNNKEISTMIDSYFTTDIDLSYTFKIKGLKSLTLGCTIYNLFNEEYESNGGCALFFKQDNGKVVAFGNNDFWSYSVYSAQAPINFMAHMSLNF